MPKSETSIVLPPVMGNAVLPLIQGVIPDNDYSVSRRIRTFDAVGSGSANALIDITIIVASSSPACIAIASIIKKWIQTKSSKKITMTTDKGTIEVENLTSKELLSVIEECKKITFKED